MPKCQLRYLVLKTSLESYVMATIHTVTLCKVRIVKRHSLAIGRAICSGQVIKPRPSCINGD